MAANTSENTRLWASFLSATASKDFKDLQLNRDLFNRMVVPACFNQCAKTDVDIVFLNEMECTYKCVITYKQAFNIIKDLDYQ